MYENSFGVPEMLPAGYGGEQGSPSTVRMNALPSAVPTHLVQQNQQQRRPPMRVVPNSPPPGFHQVQNVPAVLKLSNLENEFDDPYEHVYEYGAAQAEPRILVNDALRLYAREWDDGKGYVYQQYSDGSYAVMKGKMPKGVTPGKPFTAKENAAAFAAIKKQVEAAIGPFPTGKKLEKAIAATKKTAKPKGKKLDVGKLAQTSLEIAGKVSKKFEESGKASEAVEEAPADAAAASTETSDADMPWYAKRVMGVPVWGLVAGAVVVSGGLYLALKKPAVPVAAPPPAAPPPAPRRAAARAAIPAAPAPAPAVAAEAEEAE
jgi:hypothetical protein